jgi:hypothetical protein
MTRASSRTRAYTTLWTETIQPYGSFPEIATRNVQHLKQLILPASPRLFRPSNRPLVLLDDLPSFQNILACSEGGNVSIHLQQSATKQRYPDLPCTPDRDPRL